MTTVRRSLTTTGGAGVIACCVAFLPQWEGMDKVAKRDVIGTGHPITYCYGQTSEFGDVAVGTVFNKQECDAKLAESLPKYLYAPDGIEKCIYVDLPDKTEASLLDAAWNAGVTAVCRSPMVAKMNAGDLAAGCDAFDGWYVRSDGQPRRGLIARRAGEEHGDSRKSERALCIEGLKEGKIKVVTEVAPAPTPFVLPAPACKCATSVAAAPVPLPRPFPAARKTSRKKTCTTWWNVVTQRESRICR